MYGNFSLSLSLFLGLFDVYMVIKFRILKLLHKAGPNI